MPAASETTGRTSLPITSAGCCTPAPADASLHAGLAELTRRYNLNDYAASVKVYAVKPKG